MKVANYFLLFTSILWACSCSSHHDDDHDHDHDAHEVHSHTHNHEGHSHAGHNHGAQVETDQHEDDIVINPDMARSLGVSVDTVRFELFSPAIHTWASVNLPSGGASIVVAPTAGIVHLTPSVSVGTQVSQGMTIATIATDAVAGGDSEQAARAAHEATLKELARVKALYEEHLATLAEYNAAEAAERQARASLSSGGASRRVVSPRGGIIIEIVAADGAFVAAGEPVAMVIPTGSSLVLQAELPQSKRSAASQIVDAIINLDDQPLKISSIGGRRISVVQASARPGYMPVYFSLPSTAGLTPGTSVEVWLTGSAEQKQLVVPVSALSEQQGLYFVYALEHPQEISFVKIPVTIGATDGRMAVVTSGLNGGEVLAVKGVTAIKLAENKSVVPEGHSHNH